MSNSSAPTNLPVASPDSDCNHKADAVFLGISTAMTGVSIFMLAWAIINKVYKQVEVTNISMHLLLNEDSEINRDNEDDSVNSSMVPQTGKTDNKNANVRILLAVCITISSTILMACDLYNYLYCDSHRRLSDNSKGLENTLSAFKNTLFGMANSNNNEIVDGSFLRRKYS